MKILILSNTANPEYYYILKNCIDSINTDKYNVLVVETNSKLKTKQIPLNATFIFPEKEFNYNDFLNIGLKHIQDDKIVISNNDVVYHANCLEEIENKLNVYDSVSPVDLNTHKDVSQDIMGTKVGFHVLGCCIGLTRKTLNTIGSFDTKFKFWFQDNDYCNNLKKYNLTHALLSEAKIEHLKMKSHDLLGNRIQEMTHNIGPALKEKWPEYE